jgi:hypothetical protein
MNREKQRRLEEGRKWEWRNNLGAKLRSAIQRAIVNTSLLENSIGGRRKACSPELARVSHYCAERLLLELGKRDKELTPWLLILGRLRQGVGWVTKLTSLP